MMAQGQRKSAAQPDQLGDHRGLGFDQCRSEARGQQGAGLVVGEHVERQVEFLAEAGWDADREVFAPPRTHRLLGLPANLMPTQTT
jgi:hypothetical protein